MYDLFEYPTITSTKPEEQVKELVHYLVQFKETLEFALTNISTDNLSTDLVAKLNALGADIKSSNDEREEQIQQVVNNGLTVSDVVNSEAYQSSFKSMREAIEGVRDEIEDANKEIENVSDSIPTKYLESVEQIQASSEAGGINIYAFTDASGSKKEFTVKNGETPTVVLSVNFETGNLEYESLKEE